VALTRVGKAILPSPENRLEAGDIVYLSATLVAIDALRERLQTPQGR
jgi:Trk K+ transport system NAD-binding subunit